MQVIRIPFTLTDQYILSLLRHCFYHWDKCTNEDIEMVKWLCCELVFEESMVILFNYLD
jgi:hypothetical protein